MVRRSGMGMEVQEWRQLARDQAKWMDLVKI